MCFSATASFTASVLLGAIGIATLRLGTSRSLFFIAMIPTLFAIQQLTEGLLWLNLEHNLFSPTISTISEYLFLFFAFFLWPIWVTLSLAIPERESWRRGIIYIFVIFGIILSLTNAFYAVQQTASIHIVNHSLQYEGLLPEQKVIYPLIVIIPCFISSLRHAWIFGVLLIVTYAIAYYLYAETFVSVWCFFAAIISVSIYKVLKDNQDLLKSQSN